MPSASNLVKNLDCINCAKPLVKNGKVKCPRCKQDIELPASPSGLPEDKWRCPECQAHGFRSRHVLAVDRKIKCRWCKEDQNSLVAEETTVAKKAVKKEVTLSCKEVRLVLSVIPVERNFKEMGATQVEACKHYISCDACKKFGLAKLTGEEVDCKDALETWAAKPGPLFLYIDVENLKEALAVEHVWGRTSERSHAYFGVKIQDSHYESCEENSCRALRYYWEAAPLSCNYDGEQETAKEIPLLIDVFIERGWSIGRLLEIQRQRVEKFISAFVEKTQVGLTLEVGGEMMLVDHMGEEINIHIKELQALVRRLSVQEKKE